MVCKFLQFVVFQFEAWTRVGSFILEVAWLECNSHIQMKILKKGIIGCRIKLVEVFLKLICVRKGQPKRINFSSTMSKLLETFSWRLELEPMLR